MMMQTIPLWHMNLWRVLARSLKITASALSVLDVPESVVESQVLEHADIESVQARLCRVTDVYNPFRLLTQ